MYFITPNFSVALNAKVASSTLARAIIAAFHPEQEDLIQTAAYPEGRGPDTNQVQWLCPKEKEPSKPVVLIVRDPVARFRTAMAQVNLTDVDAALNSLESGSEIVQPRGASKLAANVHFKHQRVLASPSAKVFKLEDIEAAAIYIGLTLPLPVVNEATREKPTLTPDQEARVLAYYSEDKVLFDSVQPGGTYYAYSPPPDPPVIEPPPPVPTTITATQIRLWLVRHGISMQQVSDAIAVIPDAQARAEAEVYWEYAPYIERANPLVSSLAAVFNMDSAAVDRAFSEAAQIWQ